MLNSASPQQFLALFTPPTRILTLRIMSPPIPCSTLRFNALPPRYFPSSIPSYSNLCRCKSIPSHAVAVLYHAMPLPYCSVLYHYIASRFPREDCLVYSLPRLYRTLLFLATAYPLNTIPSPNNSVHIHRVAIQFLCKTNQFVTRATQNCTLTVRLDAIPSPIFSFQFPNNTVLFHRITTSLTACAVFGLTLPMPFFSARFHHPSCLSDAFARLRYSMPSLLDTLRN